VSAVPARSGNSVLTELNGSSIPSQVRFLENMDRRFFSEVGIEKIQFRLFWFESGYNRVYLNTGSQNQKKGIPFLPTSAPFASSTAIGACAGRHPLVWLPPPSLAESMRGVTTVQARGAGTPSRCRCLRPEWCRALGREGGRCWGATGSGDAGRRPGAGAGGRRARAGAGGRWGGGYRPEGVGWGRRDGELVRVWLDLSWA
jgi:hypothetical protein